ncbi:ABC-F family ATP-binding cassette domain-containing protein [Caldisalinibacter kiritimatiensis]|uniref:ATPase component of ABC transporter n=1 Tax=Caldisalinibacter kiritimatiensis TaxID=1304284 RepID=R1CD08_9FIRM|nr:ABC-F family ATP-binding cassette domain-containing protein [Caldisalinibacter kiritimatiensis]EOD00180.1 ATPase component of ABC transporter [Caldisalinibacter kiritimatiensis]
MIVLSCNNISKSYVVDKILDNVSFTLQENEKVGLIGLNGAGKTTLFKILAGKIPKDSGDIYVSKDCKIGYLEQQTQIYSEKSIFDECLEVFKDLIDMEKQLRELENQISIEGQNESSSKLNSLMQRYSNLSEEFNSRNGYGYKSEIRGILKGLGFNEKQFDLPLHQLSGGQKSRVHLAKLLLQKPDILLLDEPTNHLDMEAVSWLEKYIKEYRGAAIIISHDRYFLDSTVSRILLLENSIIKSYNGNYTTFMKKKKKERELLQKKYEEQQKEIKRQEEIIRSLSQGGKRAIRQAKSRQKMLDKMKVIDKPVSNNKKSSIRFEPKIKSGNDVLKVRSLVKHYDNIKLFENISFDIYKGEKVGLIGPNGIGKTTLLKIIMNQIDYSEGEITLGHHVNIGYYDQEQSNLNADKTVVDEIWDEHPLFNHYKVRKMLAQFLFQGEDIFKLVSELSGGEKSRLALLKLMLSEANFLLMDEPTNHLDIDSKEALEDSLLNYKGTLLVISHDRYFLNKVTDKILELTPNRVNEYLGNYDYYLEKKNAMNEETEDLPKKTKTQIKIERKKEKEKRKLIRKKKNMLRDIEKKIAINEEKKKELEELMCNPDIYSDNVKMREIYSECDNIKKELEKLYDEWVELTEELG